MPSGVLGVAPVTLAKSSPEVADSVVAGAGDVSGTSAEGAVSSAESRNGAAREGFATGAGGDVRWQPGLLHENARVVRRRTPIWNDPHRAGFDRAITNPLCSQQRRHHMPKLLMHVETTERFDGGICGEHIPCRAYAAFPSFK